MKCVDESGITLAMTRLYGRAPRGIRGAGSVPPNDGQHVTLLGAVGAWGLQADMTMEGPAEAEVFRTYVKRVLGPILRPGDTAVTDTCVLTKPWGCSRH